MGRIWGMRGASLGRDQRGIYRRGWDSYYAASAPPNSIESSGGTAPSRSITSCAAGKSVAGAT